MTDLADKARAGRLVALGSRGTNLPITGGQSPEGARHRATVRQENVIFFSRRSGGTTLRLVL